MLRIQFTQKGCLIYWVFWEQFTRSGVCPESLRRSYCCSQASNYQLNSGNKRDNLFISKPPHWKVFCLRHRSLVSVNYSLIVVEIERHFQIQPWDHWVIRQMKLSWKKINQCVLPIDVLKIIRMRIYEKVRESIAPT